MTLNWLWGQNGYTSLSRMQNNASTRQKITSRRSSRKNSDESLVTCTFLRNCDSLKPGSLQKNFQTQCALNNNQCPKKTSTVSNVSSSHQWDQAHNKHQKKRKEQLQESWQNNDNNNDDNESNNENESDAQLAQNHGHAMCHCCGEKGHCTSDCLTKDKMAKNNWAIEKACRWCRA